MKKIFNVRGYSKNLRMYVTRWYFEDEIFKDRDGIQCVSSRYHDNPRFSEGEYILTELEVVS